MTKQIIHTKHAPKAIGPYSQAVKVGNVVYLSGQIPLVPETMVLVGEDFDTQVRQVFNNVKAVCEAAGGSLADLVKLTIFLTDLSKFTSVNEIMAEFLLKPYPARAAIEVSALPRNAKVEIADAVMVIA